MPKRGEYSADEWHNIAANLQRSLGPEYLAQRPGPSGAKLTYIEGKTAINIANDIFGFNGWSTDIKEATIDFVDREDNKWSVGVSVTVRVTLKDGSYHEDVGYGHDQNAKSKGAAFEKARKQAVTDATKRTLRFFGNALGNCLYDNPYLNGIGKMAKPTIKFTPTNLYRHTQFEQNKPQSPPQVQQAPAPLKPAQQSTSVPQIQYSAAGNQALKTPYQNPQHKQPQQQQVPQPSPQMAKPQPSQQLKPIPAKVEPCSYPTSSATKTPVASSSNGKAQVTEEEEILAMDEKYSSLIEPIIPEDSFSYEGDDEFFAQLAAIDEEDQPREDILPVDLSVYSSSSNNAPSDVAPGSQNGSLIRREPPLSDLDKEITNKRTCVRK